MRQGFVNLPRLLASPTYFLLFSDVAKWVPPLASYVCTYVRAWVTVKHYYSLTIDSAEKTALTNYLNNC